MADPKHTLYTTKINEERFELEDGSFNIVPEHTKYSLYIGNFDAEDSELNEIYHTLREPKSKVLEVFIDSHGGLLSELQRFDNIINNYFTNTDTYLDNKGYSAGAMLFTLGHRRIVHKHSEIMFHNYSGGYYGKAHEVKDQYQHDEQHLNNYFTHTLKPFFKKKELKALLDGKDFWFGAKEMLNRNIATHILINGELIEADVYLKNLKG